MIIALLATAVLSAALSSWITIAVRPARTMTRRTRRLIDDAASILSRIRTPIDLDQADIISDRSRKSIDSWIARYDKELP